MNATTHDLAGRVCVVVVVVFWDFMGDLYHVGCPNASAIFAHPAASLMSRSGVLARMGVEWNPSTPGLPMDNPPQGIRIERCTSVAIARQRIWQAGLFVNDEETSHVLEMVRPMDRAHDKPWSITDAWLAMDAVTGQDLGAAVVSANYWSDDDCMVLNLYVRADRQGNGLGSALLSQVLVEYPDVHANYTTDSARLYHRAGVRPANLPSWYCPDEGLDERRAKFVAQLLTDRASADQAAANRTPGSPRI